MLGSNREGFKRGIRRIIGFFPCKNRRKKPNMVRSEPFNIQYRKTQKKRERKSFQEITIVIYYVPKLPLAVQCNIIY